MSNLSLEPVIEGRRSQPHQLIEVLQDVQERFGYISEEAMKIISEELGVPIMEVYRVASFYKAFSLTPRGKNTLTICMGTACHVRGAKLLPNQVRGQLGVSAGETTKDGQFTVEHVNCLGACALGPVAVLNGVYYHHTTPGKLRTLIDSTHKKEMEEESHVQTQ